MKGNNAGLAPALDEGEQMNAGMTEINVHQIRPATFKQVRQQLVLTAINDRRCPNDKLQPAMSNRIKTRRGYQLDIIERKALGVLNRFRHDESLHLPQAGDLPIDVKHLRFQKRGAVARYDDLRHNGWGRVVGKDKSGDCGGRMFLCLTQIPICSRAWSLHKKARASPKIITMLFRASALARP